MLFSRARAFQELRVELARIAGGMTAIQDHETRIRRIERYMYAIPASILTSGAAVIIAWMSHVH
jgi:hypothetical protein